MKYLLSFLALAFLIPSLMNAVSAQTEESQTSPFLVVDTDRSEIKKGETFKVGGYIDGPEDFNVSNQLITIQIIGPDGRPALTKSIYTDVGGDFEVEIKPFGKQWRNSGTYTISAKATVSGQNILDQTILEYKIKTKQQKPEPKPQPKIESKPPLVQKPDSQSPTELTVKTDKNAYKSGDSIIVYGTASGQSYSYVSIQVTSPSGNLVTIVQTNILGDNSYKAKIAETNNALWKTSGVYTIKISYGSETKTVTFEFTNSEQPTQNQPKGNEYTIEIPKGASSPECSGIITKAKMPESQPKMKSCYFPNEITIEIGSKVTWMNQDSAGHTVTSGIVEAGSDGKFDSGLFLPGKTFSYKFTEVGNYQYYCIVHPWMKASVTVSL